MKKHRSKQLDIGRAGEYITIADLIMQGEKCYLTDQGLNYDIVVDREGEIYRGQIKTTENMRVIREGANPVYFFHLRRAGKNGKREYQEGEFEFYALVALDIRKVFYVKFDEVATSSVCIRDREVEYEAQAKGGKKNGLYYQDLTWEALCQKL